jgi:uncharacterized protein with NAD-binding domain and iron-sulfur cluster
MAAATRTKVAVLGGGIGSLSAAFELTSTPELRERYELTVYQLGWRLGGKGASGRNPELAYRIEEHGLHMWMGWYQNAFRFIRRCYEEWRPDPGCAFASWRDAFKIHENLSFMDQVGGEWQSWRLEFPPNAETPGDGDVFDHSWDYWVMLIEWIERTLQSSEDLPSTGEASHERPPFVRRVFEALKHVLGVGDERPRGKLVHPSLHDAARLSRALPRDPAERTEEHHATLEHLLGEVHGWLEQEAGSYLDTDPGLRHAYVLMNLGYAVFRGLLAEGFPKLIDFDEFDDVELRAWLKKHGAAEASLHSGLLRSFYELAFAYEDGDFDRPAIAAGAGLRALLRMGVGYKGGVLWAMQAGMGDTVFTPLYDVLKARGVRFEFLRKVENLQLGDDGRRVESIDTLRQVKLLGPAYEPLIPVNGLRCWPSHPDWEQIEDGKWLEDHHVDLESHWAELPHAVREPLLRGRDFDLVVFGLSQGSIPFVCRELLANERWRKSVEKVKTVQTQALQLWLRPNRRSLGWAGDPTVLTSYVEPFSSWADMSHLIPRERWRQEQWPGNIAYLCGAMPCPPEAPPASDRGYPRQQRDAVKASALAWLSANAGRIWPDAVVNGEFNWELLVDPEERNGRERFESQYWRANVDPSERYVLCVPGSTRYRLHSDDPDYENLYLAGDWVRSCINGGCVEGAVAGGMQASRAICGVPEKIQGE